MEKVYVNPPFIKLDQLLKFCGACMTGGEAKELIQDGEVFLNGEVCLQRGKKITENDVIKVLDQEYQVLFKKNGGAF